MLSSVKLFPTLIGVSLLVLGVKISSLMTDMELLTSSAVAQDAQNKPEEKKPEGDQKKPSDSQKKADQQAKQPEDLDEILSGRGLSSSEEDRIIQKLRARSSEIDKRETALNLKEQLLQAVEKDIDSKISELDRIRGEIKFLLGEFDKREKEKLTKLVAMYSSMKPKDAAPIFELLQKNDEKVLLRVANNMQPKKFSAILAQMNANAASMLTMKMATMAKPDVDIAQ